MLGLALRRFAERVRCPDFEFHGSQIYARRGDCRGFSAEAAVQLYGELLELLDRHGCWLFIVGIDKAGLKRRAARSGYAPDHPYRLAFMNLVERIDGWLHELTTRVELREVLGLLVADEQKEVDREMIASFAAWRAQGTQYSPRRKALRQLVDTVHYVPSHDSWLIQLADCVAYLFSRYHRVQREKGRTRTRRSHRRKPLWCGCGTSTAASACCSSISGLEGRTLREGKERRDQGRLDCPPGLAWANPLLTAQKPLSRCTCRKR
jgi:uncharacterized protein DUF3800